jgi:hypothetical protein
MSPTIRSIGPYRSFFYADEAGEPPHVHVQRGNALAKFWLQPVALVKSRGFAAHDPKSTRELVEANAGVCLEAGHEFFPA